MDHGKYVSYKNVALPKGKDITCLLWAPNSLSMKKTIETVDLQDTHYIYFSDGL